jgi:hypothetical protein
MKTNKNKIEKKSGPTEPPVKPEKDIPVKPDKDPDPTETPEKNDPTRIQPGINEPEKIDPTRIPPQHP